ncbi:Alpha/Beta hydrolase protein [Hysterangium stoloniferum]|nr:Alpha/Beta hydrolase protein [Hysterangium stoloniferum]
MSGFIEKALIYPYAFFYDGRPVYRPSFNFEDLKLDTPDGIKIHLIMFHGNAENMSGELSWAYFVYAHCKCNIMMISYRGFGESEGKPSEKGRPVFSAPGLRAEDSPYNIILYGRSLGGGIALDLAARNPHLIRGIILENTFVSVRRVIKDKMPSLAPFRFLCNQRWENATAIRKLPPTIAVLMLSGLRDQVIPPAHMKELWDIAKTSGLTNTTWKEFPYGKHSDTADCSGYMEAISEFLCGFTEPRPTS